MNILKKIIYGQSHTNYRDAILKNRLESGQPKSANYVGVGHPKGLVDLETEYYFNNFGYRDTDWRSKTEILAVGCSNTFGVGVPVEGRWTNILEKKLNKKIQNLGITGGSINDLTSKLFAYFETFGNPEIILFLTPDPFRVKLPFKKDLIKGKNYDEHDLYLENVCLPYDESSENLKKSQYFKTPYSYREILPIEVPLYFSVQSLYMLDQYCKSNNIKLILSSWFEDFVQLLNNIEGDRFNNFFPLPSYLINTRNVTQDCHENYKNDFKKYFDNGADIEYGIKYSHSGVHWHVHVAEEFYKEINK